MYLGSSPTRIALPYSRRVERSLEVDVAAGLCVSRRRRAQSAPWRHTPRSHRRGRPAAPAAIVRSVRVSGLRRLFTPEPKGSSGCAACGVSDGWLSRTVRAVPAASHPACGSGCALYQGENSSWKGWAIFCPKVLGKTNCTLTLAHQVSFSSYFQIILLPSWGAVEDNMCVFMFCVLFLGAADSRGS